MKPAGTAARPGNPFATRHVRPGAVDYLLPPGESAATIVRRLADARWWGQIVGPHGSGKSTLLAALVPELLAVGRRPLLVVLRDGQRRLQRKSLQRPDVDANTQLIVDGYEQLGRTARWLLRRLCRRRGCGLLVTTHAPAGLPDVLRTAPSVELAEQIVATLCEGWDAGITSDDVRAAFVRCSGNLREMLFDLYDVYERRRGKPSACLYAQAP